MILKEVDQALLIRLHTFIYLDAPFVYEKWYQERFENDNSFRKWMNQLRKEGYIRIFSHQEIPDVGRGSVYTLGSKGIEYVKEMQGYARFSAHWSRELQIWYRHAILIARVAVAFEEQAPRFQLEMKDYAQENRSYFQFGASKKKDVIRPDGFFIVGPSGDAASDDNFGIFLEMERTLSRKLVIQDKIARYQNFLLMPGATDKYLYHIGAEVEVSEFLVLFVGATENSTLATKRTMEKLKPRQGESRNALRPGIDIPILLGALPEIVADPFAMNYYHLHAASSDAKREISV